MSDYIKPDPNCRACYGRGGWEDPDEGAYVSCGCDARNPRFPPAPGAESPGMTSIRELCQQIINWSQVGKLPPGEYAKQILSLLDASPSPPAGEAERDAVGEREQAENVVKFIVNCQSPLRPEPCVTCTERVMDALAAARRVERERCATVCGTVTVTVSGYDVPNRTQFAAENMERLRDAIADAIRRTPPGDVT